MIVFLVWIERIKGITDELIKAKIVSADPVSMCFSTSPSFPWGWVEAIRLILAR